MADIISRLKLESGEFDSKIKRASQELTAYSAHCRKMGLEMGYANKDAKEFAKSLGSMQTTATTARGKVSELSDAFVNLKAMYNQMTDAEKQGQFGKNLAASLDQLKIRTQQAKQELSDITKELNGANNIGGNAGGLFSGDKLSGMLQVFGGNLMTKGFDLATSAVTNLVGEVSSCITQGIELARQGEGVRIAFERLGRGDILQGLREATHGTVTDLELMKAAVKFNDFKLPLEELGTMLAFAQQKAKDTGQSVDYMVDSIVTGLGRKSLMILDNLGLSAAEIREKMKETGDMTKAVGAIIREQMEAAGDYVETAADRAAQANVSLQNKMEELGRKFAPLQEASNTFWTSVKVSILDIVGGPLANFLNGLTEAGRRMSILKNMQGGGDEGQSTRVTRQLSALRGSNFKNEKYRSQLNQYDQDIRVAEYYKKKYDEAGMAGGSVLSDVTKRFGVNVVSGEDIDNIITSLRTMRSEYQKGAKEIMQPVKVNVDTSKAISGVDDLKKRLKDLEDQRKKAVLSGDNDLVDNLTKQINATKQNIGYLDPNALKTGSTKVNKDEFTEIIGLIGNAQERVRDLQKQISESWDNNEIARLRKELQGAQNELDVLQGKLPKDTVAEITIKADDKEALQKLENIDGVSIGPKTFSITATEEALPLLREIEGVTIDPKTFSIAATEEALPLLREIEGITISPKTFSITATDEALPKLQEIEGVQINSKTMTVTADTTDALLKVQEMVSDMNGTIVSISVVPQVTDEDIERSLREQYGKPIEVPVVPKTTGEAIEQEIRVKLAEQNMDADMQTLRTLLETQIKNGIEGIEIPSDTLAQAIMGEGINIPDEYWSKLQDQINEKLKDMGIDPIKINFETGNIANVGKETEKSWRGAASAMSAAGSALQGLEDPGAKIAGIVGQAIANIALGFSQATAASSGGGIFGWIAAIAGGLTTMISTISAIHSATGYAQGGIVDGRGGGFVGGMAYSGDNIGNVRLDSGELVLNRSQQNNLANALEGGNNNNVENRQPYVNGELIYLGLNNYLKRTGRGEIVVSKK